MSLGSVLSIAGSGLAAINAQLALVSHNVANAATPGYAAETAANHSAVAGNVPLGVISGPAQRAVDQALQTSVLAQNANTSGLQTRSDALAEIVATQGTPGQGSDIASLLGKLQDRFSTLLADPSSQPQQQSTIQSASDLAAGIRTLSSTIGQQRQTAQDAIASDVVTANTTLSAIGALSDQIMRAQAAGQSTADLQNQRDGQIADLSHILSLTVLPQASGDVIVTTGSGVALPIHGTTSAITFQGGTVQPAGFYPGGGLTGLVVGGVDVTAAFSGGRIGANLALRDSTLPTLQAQLDEFAQNLSAGFAAAGLPLFTDGSGAVPAASVPVQANYLGYASIIQVNPSVRANPTAVRDGAPSTNPGVAGYSDVIAAVLTKVLGTAPVTGGNVSGLGPTGTLSAGFAAPSTLANFASTLGSSQASDAAATATQLGTAQALQGALQTKLSSETGVNVDTEMANMIALQNAYGANAKIIGAMQSLFAATLGMLQP